MPEPTPALSPIRAHGKFLHDDSGKWFVNGVAYGPFPPQPDGTPWPFEASVKADFAQMRALGANCIRVYHPPPTWVLDLAAEHGLRVLASIHWPQHGDTLRSPLKRRKVERELREAVATVAGHRAMLGWLVGSEIAPDVVRWMGERKVCAFLDRLIDVVHKADPKALASYASFPPTEYLVPRKADFLTFNIFLERRADYARYLARLHNLADGRPVLIGEFGLDTIRHGEEVQAQTLSWQHDETIRSGAVGTIIFTWTDEWYNGGALVEDWNFGLVTARRDPRVACLFLRRLFNQPHSPMAHAPLPRWPDVTIVVCAYNAEATLGGCLRALDKLRYPAYQIIVVDDGSKDDTVLVAKKWLEEREKGATTPGPASLISHPGNLGLSAARNTGAEASACDILAYTDADCEPDADWLYHLVSTLLSGDYAGVGGPNLPPPAQGLTPAAVAASPGGPTHVLLTDTVAEHIPGCNMAFWRWAFDAAGGFDPAFRRAGDDVDFCWRIQATGGVIAFSPGAVVWHHRRFSVPAFIAQQAGYGEAEALLRFKHPIFFTSIGSAKWRGVIYGGPRLSWIFSQPVVYHGTFGRALFQSIYPAPISTAGAYLGSIEWLVLTVLTGVVSLAFPWLRAVPILMLLASFTVALSWMAAARIEPKYDGLAARILVGWLAFLQPIARGRARWRARLFPPARRVIKEEDEDGKEKAKEPEPKPTLALTFWSETGLGRDVLIAALFHRLLTEGWRYVSDPGWGRWDVLIRGNMWWNVAVSTVTDDHGRGKCLTRVRLRASPALPFYGLIGVALFGLAAHFLLEHSPGIWVCAGATALLLLLLLQLLAIRHRIRGVVSRAAHDAHLPAAK